MKTLRVYVAGKVSKDSIFGTHDWRDQFCKDISDRTGINIINFDPTKVNINQNNIEEVFGADCYLISKADVIIVYLSDDISIGGSQEILIAKYFKKPVIGLAPHGGKFNGSTKEYFGSVVENYKDPFVFSTCDVVCDDLSQLIEAIQSIEAIIPKEIDLIGKAAEVFSTEKLRTNEYISNLIRE